MHPILGHPGRLGPYLLAWVPLAGILLYLLSGTGGLTTLEAAVMVVPLCLVYAFICLSAWYSCRGTPLETTGFWRLVLTHQTAAILVSGLWVLIARGLALALSKIDVFSDLREKVVRTYPLLFASGALLYLLAVGLHYVLFSVEASRDAERRENAARILARESELKALKAQVNPHFLFNSLNSISALTSIDAAKAREMCILLADFLRRTLGLGEKTGISLEEELALVRSFLAVEKVRFGARLFVEEVVTQDALACSVPPLLLQPLVENAVGHGISNLTEGGYIRLDIGYAPDGKAAARDEEENSTHRDLLIRVENNFDPEAPRRRGHGLGLANVRQRLDARYGQRARFDARAEGDRFRVEIVLPAEIQEPAA
jgi:two-component system, LytTR family, sensor histidine kinase AlgZ